MARDRDKQIQVLLRDKKSATDRSKGTPSDSRARTVQQPAVSAASAKHPPVLDAARLSQILFEETDPVRALHLALAFFEKKQAGPLRSKIWLRSKDRIVVRLPRYRGENRSACLATQAFLRDAVHMATGARVQAKEEKCVSRGDAFCSHQFHWDEPAA